MLERDIEKKVKEYARKRGWYVKKFTSPASRSVPDDIFLKNGFVFWIEFKATGCKPTVAQLEEHEKLFAKGGTVFICDDVDDGKSIIDRMDLYAELFI